MNNATARPSAHVFWLFGLSGAGKSTLAGHLIQSLRAQGVAILALDGDELRAGLCKGLGFTDADRAENLRRAAEAARIGLASQLSVVASFITPLEAHRQLVKGLLAPRISLIHVDAPLTVCRRRDVKGLYANANAGKVSLMTGVGSGFEAPSHTDLTLATDQLDIATCNSLLVDFALRQLAPP